MTIELVSLAIGLSLIGAIFVPVLLTGSSPVPTSRAVRNALLALLPERLPGADTAKVYELGCGWGGFLCELGRKYPDRDVIGYEVSPLPWLVARLRVAFFGPGNVRVLYASYNWKNLSDAALVMCYLLPNPMSRLKVKLEQELAPGALVLSNTFAIRGWHPLDDKMADDFYNSHVYLYEIGNTDAP